MEKSSFESLARFLVSPVTDCYAEIKDFTSDIREKWNVMEDGRKYYIKWGAVAGVLSAAGYGLTTLMYGLPKTGIDEFLLTGKFSIGETESLLYAYSTGAAVTSFLYTVCGMIDVNRIIKIKHHDSNNDFNQ